MSLFLRRGHFLIIFIALITAARMVTSCRAGVQIPSASSRSRFVVYRFGNESFRSCTKKTGSGLMALESCDENVDDLITVEKKSVTHLTTRTPVYYQTQNRKFFLRFFQTKVTKGRRATQIFDVPCKASIIQNWAFPVSEMKSYYDVEDGNSVCDEQI